MRARPIDARVWIIAWCLGASALCLAKEEVPLNAPRLAVDEPTHLFGEAVSGTAITHTFLLRNVGQAPLEIKGVEPSCGCTVTDLSENILQPGSEATLTVTLTLDSKWNSHVKKSILVESNDPKEPKFHLYMEGQAVSVITVKPDAAFFGGIPATAELKKTINITTGREDVSFTLTEISCESPHLRIEKETVQPGKAYRVHIRTAGNLQEGSLEAQVKISTDHPAYQTIVIPVKATVTGALAVSPQEILLAGPATQLVTRYVVIAPGDVKEFKVEEVEAPLASIEVTVEKIGRLGYRIRLANLSADSELEGKSLKIRTDLPQKREILVPFKIVGGTPIQ